jgi:nitrite reductase/ring-hydroxylating ferredoxin subunit
MNDEIAASLLEQTRAPNISAFIAQTAFEEQAYPSTRVHPILIGHSSQLTKSRDYITHDLSGIPVIAVRQQDGSLKAFLNVCRHRGVRVVTECAGNRRSFTCPYHGWTYGPDGGLRGIPYRQAFENINRDERGLREIPVEERHGFVWVGLTPDSAIDVSTYLGPTLDEELKGSWLDSVVQERKVVFQSDAEWPGLANDIFTSHRNISPADSTSAIHGDPAMRFSVRYSQETIGIHRRLTIAGNSLADDQVGPLSKLKIAYGLFPSDMLFWEGPHFELWSIYPATPYTTATTVSVSLLVPPAKLADKAIWDIAWEAALTRHPGALSRDAALDSDRNPSSAEINTVEVSRSANSNNKS